MIFFSCWPVRKVVQQSLSNLRLHLGQKLGLIPQDRYEFLWVLDFPLLEYDEKERRFAAVHHPFTSPKPEDVPKLESDPLAVRALRRRTSGKKSRNICLT
jgi:aspartyl-tRNA synthetase